MSKRNARMLLICGVLLSASALTPAEAAERFAAENVAPADDSPNDIVVTAQRRTERLQDVPLSVAAVSGEEMQRRAVVNVFDIIRQTPGVTSQRPSANGFPVLNIRGVTHLDVSYTNESSVAVYADDVYLGNTAVAAQQLFDLDRVEVLRGPQGTLFGRNATGGLVHYISRKPTSSFTARALAQYGNFNDVVFESAISGPLTEGIRARIAGRYNDNSGRQTNRVTGRKLSSVDDMVALRGVVEADIGAEGTLLANVHYSRVSGQQDGRAFFGTLNPSTRLACSPQAVLASMCINNAGFRDPNPDPRRPYSELASIPYRTKSVGGFVKFEIPVGSATLTSISAYEWGKKLDTIDLDATFQAASVLSTAYFIRHRQFSQELRLSGETGPLTWVAGGYYYKDKRFYTAEITSIALGNYADQKIDSIAGFAQATYALTDRVNLTAGARYTKDDKNLEQFALVSPSTPGTRNGTVRFLLNDRIKNDKITWRLGADWHVNDDVMLFASAATGFKGGGYNTTNVTIAGAIGPVTPETITTYELGMKSEFLDRKLSLNVTGFYSDYKNIQAVATVPCTAGPPTCPTPAINRYFNIGTGKIKGLELEVGARPVADMHISLGMSLNSNELHAPPQIVIGGVPLNGKKLANTPHVGLNGNYSWEPKLGDRGSIILGGDFSYQSKVFFRPDNSPLAIQKGYMLVGGRLGWMTPSNIRIEGYVQNLFKKQYFFSRSLLGDVAPANWGTPRLYGVRVAATF